MRAGLIQLSSSDDPVANIEITSRLVAQAAGEGANFILTPEVTNCVSSSRARQRDVLQSESDDITLEVLRKQAAWHGLWLLIGSLALKEDGTASPT